MNKKIVVSIVIILSLVVIGMAQVEQNQPANRFHNFDLITPVTIEGKIVAVNSCTMGTGRYKNGIQLTVAPVKQGKNVQIYMGPQSFLKLNNWELKTGDRVSIRAFNGIGKDSGSLFAIQLNSAGKSLLLRDEAGRPSWRRSATTPNHQKGQGQRRGTNGNCYRLR